MKSNKWDIRFLKLAFNISEWSKDTSTKVGSVIVDNNKRILSVGYNGFPQGVDDDWLDRYERPQKYMYTEHAERNAIYTAGRNGVILLGSTLYCTMFPCADCARGIIQTGISHIVCPPSNLERWQVSNDIARTMFEEAGVSIKYLLTTKDE